MIPKKIKHREKLIWSNNYINLVTKNINKKLNAAFNTHFKLSYLTPIISLKCEGKYLYTL